MTLVTLAQAKQQVGIPTSDTSEDDVLTAYAAAITTVVEDYKNEVIDVREIVQEMFLSGCGAFALAYTPIISLTSVESIDGSQTWDVSGLYVNKLTGGVRVISGTAPRGPVLITYQAGYETPPPKYTRGALIILQHVWESQRGVGNVLEGVAPEESIRTSAPWTIPHKALEWLGPKGVVVA
jgi:hypothetical protein